MKFDVTVEFVCTVRKSIDAFDFEDAEALAITEVQNGEIEGFVQTDNIAALDVKEVK